ncbi:MAG: ABC transporter ATP-binding protein [Frisingicoccus sp.]|uniref:ABC transporter ATP-binding protein n=1 Tax=Frisingicoccus sp. TaxID=1918627 RepID=UPI0026123532|nr:ABC transporter ATP-binding protein [Frisingicoccus sp.]MDD6232917.1 ABC transporter ATP-binding protein [Frisingicoccus sp.]
MDSYYFYTKRLCVGYKEKAVIKDIEISLPKGEILTLIGPNGAGKSTVLKSIAGQLKTLDGVIYLGKTALTDMKVDERAKKMSVVLTEKIKTEMMTCEEVVATGRYPYTGRFGILSKEDKRVVEEAIGLIHIEDIREKDFAKISDGQKQRVMLARAMCQEPEILILDEPTSYLDVKYKLEFLSLLQEMRRKKELTVIMSLHELELAERVSDKILCLKGEYTEKYGTPGEVFTEGYIKGLFDMTKGSFDEENGNMELEPVKGVPEIFVIAGGGTGRPIFRRLQREGKAFAAGILYENDLDFPPAKALAVNVIGAKAFEPMAAELAEQAKQIIDQCGRVICTRKNFGSFEMMNKELLDYAMKTNKRIEIYEIQKGMK